MAVAFILLLVAVGSVLFHLYSPWWWTPIATNWGYIDHTITLTFWITGAVFFAVIAFMAYCVFRFHHKEGRRADYNPENKKLEWWLTIGTAIGVASHVGARLVRLAPVRHGSGRCDRGRGHGPAMALELPASRKGRPAGHLRCPQRQFRQSDGVESRRSAWARRRRHCRTTTCTCRSGSRSRFCSAQLTSCMISMCPSSGPRWIWSRAGHLFLDHPDPHRNIRCSLRGAVRRRARADAEQGHRRGRE